MNIESNQNDVTNNEKNQMQLMSNLLLNRNETSSSNVTDEVSDNSEVKEQMSDGSKITDNLKNVKGVSESNGFTKKTTSPSLNRKNKPPNLVLSDQKIIQVARNVNGYENSYNANGVVYGGYKSPVGALSPLDSPASADASTPLVTLPKRIVKVINAGINVPVVRRNSRMEEILKIPDVKAALVHDAGIQFRERLKDDGDSFMRANYRRQQTPGGAFPEGHFSFDEDLLENSGSIDESEASSVISSKEDREELEKTPVPINPNERPHLLAMRDTESKLNALEMISNNLGPTNVFKNIAKSESPSNKAERHRKNLTPSEEQANNKQSTFLSRFKFTSFRATETEVLEGWDSLTRALARVGVTSPSLSPLDSDSFEINPKLISILKRPRSRLSVQDVLSLTQDPNSKQMLPKKSVSFSRLPAESKILNADDCVSRMCKEQQFMKLRSSARVYHRIFWYDPEENCLRWKPSKKEPLKAKLNISQIRDVRLGKRTELFLSSDVAQHFPDDISFSIIYMDGKTLDLVADSANQVNIWNTGLRHLLASKNKETHRTAPNARDIWLHSVFQDADINKDGFLDEDESLKLITTLSDGICEISIKQMLQEYFQNQSNDDKQLTRDEFVQLFKDVVTRPEIYFILVRYATQDDKLTLDDLAVFLESEQGYSDITEEVCLEIIQTFEPSEDLRSIPALGIDGFTKYLMSQRCNLFNPKYNEVCQDMSQPLPNYFIASSHNTYLMEDQLGPSNISAYIRALLRCCRAVELDCWDGPDGSPVVTHGHTRSNSIPFNHVINAISECAFHNSQYPVILSIENHCSEDQQRQMANILKEVLGKKIYTENFGKETFQFPSPDSLRNQFLIRSRKLPTESQNDVGYVTDDDEGGDALIELSNLQNENNEVPVKREKPTKEKRVLVREFSDLVALEIVSDDLSVRGSKLSRKTCSLQEESANEAVVQNANSAVTQTKNHLIRVYPSGYHHDSGNFNPQDYWNGGVQMASLNYQTPGLMMDINDGKFSMNGGCGYVLKPEVMTNELQYYNADSKDGLPGVVPKLLQLRIISGQNFPKPRGGGAKGQVIDPYVLIELFGFPADCSDQRTRTALNNSGGSPIFDEMFEFKLVLPSLALIRFVVLDDDFIIDEFIGQYTIPFDCLQPGYRHLKLRSLFDEPLEDASLFVHIAIADPDFSSPFPSLPPSNLTPFLSKPTSKRASQRRLKRQRSRKELNSTPLYELNKPEIDNIFESCKEHLELASSLISGFHSSLTGFKEACGVSRLSSIKQCIRSIAKRDSFKQLTTVQKQSTKLKTENGSTKKTERHSKGVVSETNNTAILSPNKGPGSSETRRQPAAAYFAHDNEKVMLVPDSSHDDESKKVGTALNSLMDDCKKVINQALNCCNTLSSFYEKTSQLYKDFSDYLNHCDAPVGPEVFSGNGTIGKKQGKAKKQSLSGASSPKRLKSILDHFFWNCSAIKGRRDVLFSCHKQANEIFNDLWATCVQCGLAVEGTMDFPNHGIASPGTSRQNSSDNNKNNNGNTGNSLQFKTVRKGSRRLGKIVRSKSFTNKPPIQTKTVQRSSSEEGFVGTLV